MLLLVGSGQVLGLGPAEAASPAPLEGSYLSANRLPPCSAHLSCGAGLPALGMPSGSCSGGGGVDDTPFTPWAPSLDFRQGPCCPSPVTPSADSVLQLALHCVFPGTAPLSPELDSSAPVSLMECARSSVELGGRPGFKESLSDPQREPLVCPRGDSCCVHVLTEQLVQSPLPARHPWHLHPTPSLDGF